MAFQHSVVYTITSGDDLYVGSTKNFTERWGKHKSNITNKNSPNYNHKVYQVIRENKNQWSMTIHHEYPCDTEEQLCIEEQKTMDELQPTLNDRRAYSTEEQKKEHKAEYHAQWRKDNKEYQAQWYQDNKDKIAQRRAEKITCVCGAIVSRRDLARHKRSKKHLNYMLP